MMDQPEVFQTGVQMREVLHEEKPPRSLAGLKISLLTAIGAVFGYGAAGFFARLIETAAPKDALLAGIGLVGFVLVVLLEVFFVARRASLLVALACLSLALIAPFAVRLYPSPSLLLIIGWAFATLLICTAGLHGKRIIGNSIEIQLFSVARAVLPKIITGILVFTAVVLYLSCFAWGGLNEKNTRALSDHLADAAGPVVKIWFTETSVDGTVNEFITAVARTEIRKIKTDLSLQQGSFETAYDLLPAAEKEKIIESTAVQIRTALESFVGPLDPEEPFKAAMYRVIGAGMNDFAGRLVYPPLFGIVVVAIFFFLIRSVAPLTYWFFALFALVAYKTLIAAGFGYVSIANARKEVIVVS